MAKDIVDLNGDYETVKGKILGDKPAEDTPEMAAYNAADRMINPTLITTFNPPAESSEAAKEEYRAHHLIEVGNAWALMEVIRDTLEAIKNGEELPDTPRNRGYDSNLLFWKTMSPELKDPDYVIGVIDRYHQQYASTIEIALKPT